MNEPFEIKMLTGLRLYCSIHAETMVSDLHSETKGSSLGGSYVQR